jgi:hypothetical protein
MSVKQAYWERGHPRPQYRPRSDSDRGLHERVPVILKLCLGLSLRPGRYRSRFCNYATFKSAQHAAQRVAAIGIAVMQ